MGPSPNLLVWSGLSAYQGWFILHKNRSRLPVIMGSCTTGWLIPIEISSFLSISTFSDHHCFAIFFSSSNKPWSGDWQQQKTFMPYSCIPFLHLLNQTSCRCVSFYPYHRMDSLSTSICIPCGLGLLYHSLMTSASNNHRGCWPGERRQKPRPSRRLGHGSPWSHSCWKAHHLVYFYQ